MSQLQWPEWESSDPSIVVLKIGPLFKGHGLDSDSEAFLLGLVSVSDWTNSGFLIKTGQDSAISTMTDNYGK